MKNKEIWKKIAEGWKTVDTDDCVPEEECEDGYICSKHWEAYQSDVAERFRKDERNEMAKKLVALEWVKDDANLWKAFQIDILKKIFADLDEVRIAECDYPLGSKLKNGEYTHYNYGEVKRKYLDDILPPLK